VWQRRVWVAGCLAASSFACDANEAWSCGRVDGCKLAESCRTTEDCESGLICTLTQGDGLLGPYRETVCARPTGSAGQRCASLNESTSGLPLCVVGTRCAFGRHTRVAVGGATLEDVGDAAGAAEGGGIFWADTRESDEYYKLSDDECVPDGTLAIGETCLLGDQSCYAGLICHTGYEPHQCRPRSELGGPCNTGRVGHDSRVSRAHTSARSGSSRVDLDPQLQSSITNLVLQRQPHELSFILA